jgi:hypothetical protein
MSEVLKYNLDNINHIKSEGFNYIIPDETVKIINDLAYQVGSPNYIKTPIFKKNDNFLNKKDEKSEYLYTKNNIKRKKNNKTNELINNEDWEILRNFQTTKLEIKTGLQAHIDSIRALINKITDKNNIEITNKIKNILNLIYEENNNLTDTEEKKIILIKVAQDIFDIASLNKYYSKIYSDLYCDLIKDFNFLENTWRENLNKFIELCNNIEYVDPNKDYDKFCLINKINDKRKSLANFYLNLMYNNVLSINEIKIITRNILYTIYNYIKIDDKKNIVDELVEIIAILYKKYLYDDEDEEDLCYELIEGYTISEIIEKISQSNIKDYKSLTNKSLFKFMDLIE